MLSSSNQQFFQLVYISQAADTLGYNDIESILKSSKAQNLKNKISGVLIHRDGFFIQFLEGNTEAAVKETMSRIIQDTRHHTLRVVSEWKSNEKLFSNWQMGFFDSDVQELNPEFSFIQKILSDCLLVSWPQQSELISFFKSFAKICTDLK